MGIRSFLRDCRGAVEGELVTDPVIDDDGVVRNVGMMDGPRTNIAAGYKSVMWRNPEDDNRTAEERAAIHNKIWEVIRSSRDIYGR